MPRKSERERSYELEATYPMGGTKSFGSMVTLEEGWTVPGRFTVKATIDPGEPEAVTVEFDVVTEEGSRPRVERLCIEPASGNVDSTTLRQVPIRELLPVGLTDVIMRVTATARPGEFKLSRPAAADHKELVAVIKRAVGWLS